MSRTPMLLGTILALSLTTACARNSTETVRTISNFCLIAKGISYSEKKLEQVEDATNKYDTPETVEQVKAHDRVFVATCPRPTPEQ